MNPTTAPLNESAQWPLYVDLDGTLTRTDTLHESVMLFVRRHPLNLLRLLAWLLLGKAGFKQRLADAVRPDPARLPYHDGFLQYLRDEHGRGRPLVLASAADQRIVQEVADHLRLFEDALGSNAPQDGRINLSRERKRAAIDHHAREGGHARWAYAGNSRDDLPVWAGSAQAVAVNAPEGVLASLREVHPQARVFAREPLRLGTVLRAIRLKQWSKNALLFVPLLAAHSLDPQRWAMVLMAFLAFGLCASATYLFNDLLDLPNDRVHRLKRHRPLAAAAIAIPTAVLLGLAMLVLAFVLAWAVSPGFTAMLAGYTVATLAYSMVLKRLALVDVLMLSGLYTLRIGAGAVAAGVDLSNWLLAISIFLFLSLALVKRCAELEEIAADEQARLAPGRGYQMQDLPSLRAMGLASGFLSVMVLALYIDSQNSHSLYRQPDWLWGAAPLLLLWIMRIWLKTGRRELHGEDPLQFALRDPFSWAMLIAMGGIGLLATTGF
ncbi:UbiA family prenyltransferase [Hydrogenophaga sp.]|uniref:UbiA family prenyltransferase n=1 Tax=Hydrogenophaga sp. TaxID=1904254 RepID=UPI002610A5E0|nr:UbiA family prenyltransferase [Hydrogenophaga sp.]MCW5654849.1 UbiA family prenyltransferase [Hydrogenophaga sp.]